MDRLFRLFCRHKHTIFRVKGKKLFTECLDCGHESPGVVTGINPYRSEAFSRIED